MEVPLPSETQPGWLSCHGKVQVSFGLSPPSKFHLEFHHSSSLSAVPQVQLNWDMTIQIWTVQAEVEHVVAPLISLGVNWI